MTSALGQKIQRFLICKFCYFFRLLDYCISTAINIQPDDDCILEMMQRKKESNRLDANKLGAINKPKQATCQIRVTKLDILVYVIIFEIYIGFRLVFAFPECYPQFAWLFDFLHTIREYWKCYIDSLRIMESYPSFFVVVAAAFVPHVVRWKY